MSDITLTYSHTPAAASPSNRDLLDIEIRDRDNRNYIGGVRFEQALIHGRASLRMHVYADDFTAFQAAPQLFETLSLYNPRDLDGVIALLVQLGAIDHSRMSAVAA